MLFSNNAYETEMHRIESALADFHSRNIVITSDSTVLHYHRYYSNTHMASIVILHGANEYAEKYNEIVWYLFNKGYTVYTYDQRGHGYSSCATGNDILHIDRFQQYVDDLDCLMQSVIIPQSQGKPIHMLAHSMGGAVGLNYIHQHPFIFNKVILSYPLIAPYLGNIPFCMARFLNGLQVLRNGARSHSSRSSSTHVGIDALPQAISRERFQYQIAVQHANPCYQPKSVTCGWNKELLRLHSRLCQRRWIRRLHQPFLLLSAAEDTTVSNAAHAHFASRCLLCTHQVIPNAAHAITLSSDEVLQYYMQTIILYLNQ